MSLFFTVMWTLSHGWMSKGHEDRDQERGKSRNSSWLPEHKRNWKEERYDLHYSILLYYTYFCGLPSRLFAEKKTVGISNKHDGKSLLQHFFLSLENNL